MIRNYLITAWRSAKRQPMVWLLNLGGLSLSVAACLAIFIYVKSELAFDTSHPGHERIYRITEIIEGEGHVENSSSCPFPTLPALVADHGAMLDGYSRVFDFQIPVKSLRLENGELFNERGFYYVDSTAFDLFDLPIVRGDKRALVNPFSIVLSERLAQKYFGDADPIGQVVYLAGQDKLKCTVTAVMGRGGASHFQPEALISIETCRTAAPFMYKNWVWNPCWTYVRLREGLKPAQFEAELPAFVQKNYPEFNRNMVNHYLQPISDIHLKSQMEFEMGQNSSMKYIYIFISTGIILLIIAAVNFVNLSTASLLARAREVGVRKVSGATRQQLITQVLSESLMNTLLAVAVGILLLLAINPLLESLFGERVQLGVLLDPVVAVTVCAATAVLAFLSGIYPAVVFADMDVASVFKGTALGSLRGKWFRRTLVVAQFAVAVMLIVFTVIAQQQLQFMQQRDKGFDASNILVLDIQTTPLQTQLKAFKDALRANASVINVTVMNDRLGIGNNNHEFNHKGMQEGEWKYFPALCVDEDFVQTFGIELLAGRHFEPGRDREDSTAVVINRAMSQWLGFESPEQAIGEQLKSMTGDEKIVGVTEDFHFKSLHHPVGPFVLDIAHRPSGQYIFFSAYVAVKVADMEPETIAHIEKVWKQFVSNKPFDYRILDHEIKALYAGEQRMSVLLKLFSGLALLVACMGLFALTWFVAQSKTREIAVRKVHGAGLHHLIMVATREQLVLILFSFSIAFPVAYLALGKWLESFAYRVVQHPLAYVWAGVLAVAVAMITMLYIAVRTAGQNPATVLKCD